MKVFFKTTVYYLDADGTRVPKGTEGAEKKTIKSKKYYGRYKDGGGIWRTIPLYVDKEASKRKLSNLECAVARGEEGLLNPYREHLAKPIEVHVADYLRHMETKGLNPKHLSERSRILRLVLKTCEISTLSQLNADAIDDYIAGLLKTIQRKKGDESPIPEVPASARTKDTHRGAVYAFCAWLVMKGRLPDNPITRTAKPKGEVKRPRRAESVENLQKLVDAARRRPLLEATMVRKGDRKGECYANVRPEVREACERLGWERALTYKLAIMTGFRQGELRRLQVNQLRLEGDDPAVMVKGYSARKNKRDQWLPLLPTFADEIRQWVSVTGKSGTDLLLCVPEKPNKILRRDLKLAGIPYRDDDGYYFDFHSFRHCTATYLNREGVSPSVVMLFLRHSKIDLSMVTYNDTRQLDKREALAALPVLD